MSSNWLVKMHDKEGYSIVDPSGHMVANYCNWRTAAASHTFVVRENYEIRTILRRTLYLIDKGFQVQIDKKWPVLATEMEDVKQAINEVLYPELRGIKVEP